MQYHQVYKANSDWQNSTLTEMFPNYVFLAKPQ